jgi:hypothetical protein
MTRRSGGSTEGRERLSLSLPLSSQPETKKKKMTTENKDDVKIAILRQSHGELGTICCYIFLIFCVVCLAYMRLGSVYGKEKELLEEVKSLRVAILAAVNASRDSS